MFGIKDIFTTINVLGGVVAICLCIEGEPYWAGFAIMIGYGVGDTMDGWVARKLNTANEFGSEYDTIADHAAHIIAPAAVVYTVYRDVGLVPAPWSQILAMALAGSIIVAASVRHARNIVRPVTYKGIWGGLPRSVLGFLAIAFVNSSLAPHMPGGWWFGVAFISFISFSTLTYWPFANHHLARRHRWAARAGVVLFAGTTTGAAVFLPEFLFDVFLLFMVGYSVTSWMALTSPERKEFRELVRNTVSAKI